MPTKTIKDVDEETWRKLKVFSAENSSSMGKTLKKITQDYEEKNRGKEFWSRILKGEKILSDNEANDMLEIVKKLRKEHGFR